MVPSDDRHRMKMSGGRTKGASSRYFFVVMCGSIRVGASVGWAGVWLPLKGKPAACFVGVFASVGIFLPVEGIRGIYSPFMEMACVGPELSLAVAEA